jgi:hypothetical protein
MMLDLAAALRMREWELGGIAVHREDGLLSAHDTIGGLIFLMELSATRPALAECFGGLARQVFALSASRFVWTAKSVIGADVTFRDDLLDDAFLKALAAFLWDSRTPLQPE